MHRALAPLLILACTLSACRTYIPYTAAPASDAADAQRIIRQTLEEQQHWNPVGIEVTDESFRLIRSQRVKGDKLIGTSVYYARIADMLLSRKRGVYAVTIKDCKGVVLIHVFPYDEESGKRFIDALATMRALRAPAACSRLMAAQPPAA